MRIAEGEGDERTTCELCDQKECEGCVESEDGEAGAGRGVFAVGRFLRAAAARMFLGGVVGTVVGDVLVVRREGGSV